MIRPSWLACFLGRKGTGYKFAKVEHDGILITQQKKSHKISFNEIHLIEAELNGFWHSARITLGSKNQVILGGIPKKRLLGFLLQSNEHLSRFRQEKRATDLVKKKADDLRAFEKWHAKTQQGELWVTQKDLEHISATMNGCREIFSVPLESVTSSTEIRNALIHLKAAHKASSQFREVANHYYVKNEQSRFKQFFDTIESNPLTEAQRKAIITYEHNVLVIAGAGSGKTSVIVAKAGYLLKKEFCQPNQLLLLAYNRSAAEEMSERIKQRIGIDARATTFHALGLSILGKVEGAKPSLTRFAEENQLRPLIRELMLDLTSNAATAKLIRAYFQSFFAPYKSETEFATLGDYFNHLSNNNLVTLKGETLKSYEEIEIANFLCLNGIAYEYERKYEYPLADPDHRQYQPDFYLTDYGIYIEHFGVGRDGSTASYVDPIRYAEGMAWKRQVHSKHKTILVETFSYEKREGNLLSSLTKKLETHGVILRPIEADELAAILKKSKYLDPFSDLVATFLHHFKGGGHSIEGVRERARHLKKLDSRLDSFLKIFEFILERYEQRLAQDGDIDFNDMIIRAAKYAEGRQYQSPYTHILVDEFQDISSGRARLVKALAQQSPSHRLFCVGDDWQAIYRFAGSDIALMRHFKEHFGWTEQVALDRTFRFNDRIEAVATRFVLRNPAQISKTIRTQTIAKGPQIFIHRPEEKQGNLILNVLKDLMDRAENTPSEVLFLGRYNFLGEEENFPWNPVRQAYPNTKFRFQTVHRSKGQEADYVIVLGMQSGKYGFPSEVTDDPLLDLVLSEPENFAHAEERRLFYVALTRARHAVHLIADYARPSDFLAELIESGDVFVIGKGQGETVYCPVCKTGMLLLRSTRQGAFYGCSHYPRCTYTTKPCSRCGTGFLAYEDINQRYVCNNSNCRHIERLCPRCKTGRLVERQGRNGPFLGCTNYSKGICRYTENFLI